MMCILPGLQELWVKKMDIYLPTHAIAEALTVKYDVEAADLTSMLLCTYILTGCDTVSYMYRRSFSQIITCVHISLCVPISELF